MTDTEPAASPGGRIAYLVLAHEHPGMLGRLCRSLAHPGDRFFVHLDTRAAIEPFRALTGTDVSYIGDRRPLYWASWSLVEATLALMRSALAAAPDADSFCLLSGVSYPLLPTTALRQLLLAGPILQARPRTPDHPEYVRVARYYLQDSPWIGHRRRPEDEAIAGDLRGYVTQFLKKLPPPPPLPEPLWKGPQWWNLPRATVDYVLAAAADPERAEFQRRLRYSHVPDESYIQSLVYNGPHRPRQSRKSHYVDWTRLPDRLPPQWLEDPALLPQLIAQPLPFARKFHPERSAALLDAIDRHRAGTPA